MLYSAIRLTLLAALLMLASTRARAQGCSDAGFCTMGAMKPDQSFAKKASVSVHSFELSQYIGVTRFDDVILAYTADATFSIKDKLLLQVKLPYQATFGPLANTSGISDISLSLSKNLVQKPWYQINVTAGFKIPTGTPDKTNDEGRPLPMYYQPTLGTFDVVLGASYLSHRWLVAVGYQQPLNQVDNEFRWGAWEGSGQLETARLYPVSQDLYRGNDAMLRVERNFRLSKVNMNLGLLSIYRLNEDRFTSPQTEQRVTNEHADGLALTLLYGLGYRISPKSSLKLMFGQRLIKRHANPDGLSREFVNTIAYQILF